MNNTHALALRHLSEILNEAADKLINTDRLLEASKLREERALRQLDNVANLIDRLTPTSSEIMALDHAISHLEHVGQTIFASQLKNLRTRYK